jgi:hypothetical protein
MLHTGCASERSPRCTGPSFESKRKIYARLVLRRPRHARNAQGRGLSLGHAAGPNARRAALASRLARRSAATTTSPSNLPRAAGRAWTDRRARWTATTSAAGTGTRALRAGVIRRGRQHDLRHTYITSLIEVGIGAEDVAPLVGTVHPHHRAGTPTCRLPRVGRWIHPGPAGLLTVSPSGRSSLARGFGSDLASAYSPVFARRAGLNRCRRRLSVSDCWRCWVPAPVAHVAPSANRESANPGQTRRLDRFLGRTCSTFRLAVCQGARRSRIS